MFLFEMSFAITKSLKNSIIDLRTLLLLSLNITLIDSLRPNTIGHKHYLWLNNIPVTDF